VTVDRPTIEVYERQAGAWSDRRRPTRYAPAKAQARAFGQSVAELDSDGPVVDLGCGPGWHTAELGRPAVAFDAAAAMLDLVPSVAPQAWRVRGDLGRLPFRRGSLRAAFASHSYVHLPRRDLPLALHDLHRSLAVGGLAELRVFAGDEDHATLAHDDFPGRRFSLWPPTLFRDVIEGAGFTLEHFAVTGETGTALKPRIVARATRAHTLADTVGPDMRLLVCGLNPSLYAADAGVGFARPGNRFWPAAVGAGLVRSPFDPVRALLDHGVGMTDLVKRASPRADGLRVEEYEHGVARIDRVARWLEPTAVCFVGLSGWRLAVDPRAKPGRQEATMGGRPVYVMPNTSGANASSSLADLVGHLRAAQALAAA
jgi:TDG/mug DNA glycosylase family protein